MAVVALYPLSNTTLNAVRTWWQQQLPLILQNGGANSAFSPLARSVVIVPLAAPVIAVQFDSATDANTGNADLQQFWKTHGVGKLNSPAMAVPTPYGPDPNAMMVWCPTPH
ncbi:MAG TPA: hypothetical protein VMU51_02420 [Mycobacteriales bacterium]|nr:hypothetical protein [Mycobacteriales bacterium]